ncbi:hypothetical protein B0H11DRAFT_153969 [Mycena galericulata]|nr:hypothetical protein B0H11DRAFT_153969 [Mycena galericulata]
MGDEVEPTLARLEAEIWNQESTKTALLEQLASLESSLAHLRAKYGIIKNRTALIGILPNEILAKIFELGRDLNRPGGDHFEIVVSHVSHLWRQVAIRAPSLWNILEIAPHTSGSLATYLDRAKVSSTYQAPAPSFPFTSTIRRHAVLSSVSIS